METLPIFLTLAAVHYVAIVSPGPNFFVVSQTAAQQGRRAGLGAAAGVCAAVLVWCAAALLGLELVMRQAAWLLRVLQFCGGLYLAYLGIKLLRHAGTPQRPSDANNSTFWKGFRTSFANPKVMLFFGSVLSAVFSPGLPGWVKWAAFGLIAFNEISWYLAVVFVFSTQQMQRSYEKAAVWIDRTFGLALGAFGLRLCWTAND